VKLLPALIISDDDCEWIESAFEKVIADSHRVPGAIWSFGMTLAGHALKARAGA
jgi:ornithine--oxo-acid transaminase